MYPFQRLRGWALLSRILQGLHKQFFRSCQTKIVVFTREIYLPSGIVMVIVGRYGLLVLIFGGHDRGELLYPAGCFFFFFGSGYVGLGQVL